MSVWCLAAKKVYLKLNDQLSIATDWSSEIHKRYKVSTGLAIWRLLVNLVERIELYLSSSDSQPGLHISIRCETLSIYILLSLTSRDSY